MSIQKHQILNLLLRSWPHGTVAVTSWLKEQGVSRQLAVQYQKSSWITSIGQGAFIQVGDRVDWMGGVYALQSELHLPVHVGGRTALQMQGAAHFLPMGVGHPTFLFGLKRSLPKWFTKYAWNHPVHNIYTNSFAYQGSTGLTEKDLGTYSIQLSTRELAMLEVLFLIGTYETYDHAVLLMEGLHTLRPDMVQELLEKCSSVKVKRLFMYLAEHFDHPWVKRLDLSKVDFGRGKRMLAGGGQFDSKYNISVPKIAQ